MGERRWEASEWLALAVLAVGALVWVGYFTHSPWMERLQPGEANANMTAATAATLLLAGWSLLLSPRRRWVTLVPLLALSVAGLWENIANSSLPIDLAAWTAWGQGDALHPGRMSPLTAVGMVLFSAALLLLPSTRTRRKGNVLSCLTWLVIVAGLVGVLGFFIHLELIFANYEVARMAMLSGLCLLTLGVALWLQWKDSRWNRSIEGQHGRRIMRAAALSMIGVVVAAGFGSLWLLQRLATRDTATDLALRRDERVSYVQLLIREALSRGQTLAADPAIVAAARGRAPVAQLELPHGFAWLALSHPGAPKLQLGHPVHPEQPAVHLSPDADLLWDGVFYVRQDLPIRYEGKAIGALKMEQPLLLLASIGVDTADFGETGEIGLCGRNPQGDKTGVLCFPQRLHPGSFIMHDAPDGIEHPMNQALAGRHGVSSGIDYRGQSVLAAYAPVPGLNLGLVVKMDNSELYGPVRRQLEVIVPLLALLVIVGLEWLRWQVRPLVEELESSHNAALTSEARFRAAAESGLDPFYILQSVRSATTGNITGFTLIYANRPGQKLAGLQTGSSRNRGLESIPQLAADPGMLDKLRTVVASRRSIAEELHAPSTLAGGKATGDSVWFNLQAVPLSDGVAVTLHDISERKTEQEHLLIMAQTDPLTGLANRRAFYKRLLHAMDSSRRLRHQRLLAVLYLDIDRFKQINDSLGHTAGDYILQVFAQRLLSCVRSADTVARPGGDEFTVLLENLDARSDAERVIAAIFAALYTPIPCDGHVVPTSTSIGVAYFEGEEIDADELLRRADNALYAAKRGGRNQYRVFEPDLRASQ